MASCPRTVPRPRGLLRAPVVACSNWRVRVTIRGPVAALPPPPPETLRGGQWVGKSRQGGRRRGAARRRVRYTACSSRLQQQRLAAAAVGMGGGRAHVTPLRSVRGAAPVACSIRSICVGRRGAEEGMLASCAAVQGNQPAPGPTPGGSPVPCPAGAGSCGRQARGPVLDCPRLHRPTSTHSHHTVGNTARPARPPGFPCCRA